jgi:hypothetical protein
MLVWIVVLVLGEQRSSLHIMLGALLTGLMVTTREEIVVVLPILLLFIFWRYGLRIGLLATLAAGLPVVILYAVYWPGILRLSGTITPFLNAWQISDIGVSVWNNSLSFSDRWQSFLLGLRTGFVPLAGVIGLSPLCLWKDQWRTKFYWQAAVFLSVLFIVLLVLYGWAALGMNYCVYCFEGYLAFIAPLGLALIVVTFVGWKAEGTRWFPWYTVALVILLLTSVGYSAQQEIGPTLLDFPLPRVKAGQILSGAAPLGAILENAFGVDYRLSRWLVSAFGGLLLGIILLLIAWLIFRSRRTGVEFKRNKGLVIISVMLATGMLLSPTVVLAGAKQDRDCSRDVIASYESVGERLAEVIAPGHSVFWEGGLSVAPLLYLPGIKIYPAQINNGYSHRVGGNVDDLRRIGLWNDEMKEQWLEEADFILIEKPRYDDEWKEFLETGRFEELRATPSYLPCRDVPLRIFRRNKLDQSED